MAKYFSVQGPQPTVELIQREGLKFVINLSRDKPAYMESKFAKPVPRTEKGGVVGAIHRCNNLSRCR